MRNPNKSVARSDAWQQLGAQLRKLLDEALEDDDTITTLVAKLRAGVNLDEQPTVEASGEDFAALLAKHFDHGKDAMITGPSGWRWRLMELITQAAEDKDTNVAAWMQGCTPCLLSSSRFFRKT